MRLDCAVHEGRVDIKKSASWDDKTGKFQRGLQRFWQRNRK